MVTHISRSPEETFAVGEAWGLRAKGGQVIGLVGDLGSGKTQFVKGLAAGLGVHAEVHSPTFALVNEYEGGRLSLAHLDLYRLDSVEEILAAGLEEFLLSPAGVTVVEWFDRCRPLFAETGQYGSSGAVPQVALGSPIELTFEILNDTERKIIHPET